MRIEHIEFRIEQQHSYIELIENAYDGLIQVEGTRINRTRIFTRIKALKELWDQFTINNKAINLAISKLQTNERIKVKECSYFKDKIYSNTYERYLDNLGKMNELLDSQIEFDSRPLASSSFSQTLQPSMCHAPRLPRIDLPKFNGNLADWLPFRDLFASLVISNQAISPVEKLQYLTSSLHGSAAHLLRNTALTADNFQKSWDALVSFYENKRLLVNSALQTLFSIKKLTRESASEVEYLYTSIMQVYRTLETLGRPVETWDDVLVFMITQRLDPESIRAWENCLGSSKEPPKWEQLRDFLLTRMLSLQAVEKSQACRQPLNSRPPARSHVAGREEHSTNDFPRNNSCPLCSEKHYIAHCALYHQKTPKQRKEVIHEKGCCFNCLGFHQASKCKSTRRCNKCGKKHHTSLHTQENISHSRSNSSSREMTNNDHVSIVDQENKMVNHASPVHLNEQSITLLATAQVKVRDQHGHSVQIRALLDQGSEITLITETLAQRLRLPREATTFPILGIGGKTSCHTRGTAVFHITPHFDSSKLISLRAHILPKLTSSISAIESPFPKWSHLQNLRLADPQYLSSGKIDLLIGADFYGQLLEGSIIKGPIDSPTAQLTSLGWIISGPLSEFPNNSNVRTLHCSIDHDLCHLLEKFWHQEEIDPAKIACLSIPDKNCEEHFLTNFSRDATSGKYVVRLPFKDSVKKLGDSKFPATRMLEHMQKKFVSSPIFFQKYTEFLEEYEKLHHMIPVPEESREPEDVFYLPHHGVIRESSTTTKLRVVFNGSCKLKTGKSINEILHTGEKLQTNLVDVLIWLRQFKYIFSADVEKMYRQINIHPDDWKFQRIIWKKNGEIKKYELTTVTYGLACAPFLALRCVQQLIQDEGNNFPLAVDTLSKGRYVDDVFGGADTIDEARDKARQVLDLCMAGGFPLKKWNSNNTAVLDLIPSEYQTKNASVSIDDDVVHALGLSWNTSSDTLQFKLLPLKLTSCTKRTVLSQIAQFFDPLGLLSPVFIQAKFFMQELWAIKLGWDDPLPLPYQQKWQQLLSLLEDLETISVPRWTGIRTDANIELHGFCDASQCAMAATVYVRTIDCSNSVTTILISSKTKVAPIKRITIPRLELIAAVMLTKLISHCRQILNFPDVPCYLWTDSAIVTIWINNHPSRWKDFVHNRVCYIQEKLPTAQWRHVPGTCNPADCATRGMSAKTLKSHDIWWHGPSWLTKDSVHWPKLPIPTSEPSLQLEEKTSNKAKVSFTITSQKPWNLLIKYSSLNRLLRITARCQRAVKIFKKELRAFPDQLLIPEDIEEAKKYWIKQIQQEHFAEEIKTIKNGDGLAKSNSLIRLTPFIDNDGLLRVGGRLENSSLSQNSKHPYILPSNNHLSRLIIDQAHEKTLHGSTQETLIYIRNDYWILGGRNPVRSHILKCVKCTRFRKANAQQLMGQLPPSRVNPSRAFLHAGVDYAGPFSLKAWKGRTARSYKSWVALFVCLSTSAIHLELVTDYTSEAFIAAYKRFIGRRGICATLSSDCGTNFKGADQELKRLFESSTLEYQQIASSIANDGTRWKFNPPSAPHFGGKWEAGVKSFKYHFRRITGSTLLTYEEMTTVLIQIEAILNSRPISPLTNDPEDLNVLTPAHFLIGQSLTLIPEPNLEHLQISRLSRWQHLSQMIQGFWTKWSKEYLQRHHSIYKWNKASNQLSTGTLVFIMDERYPPAKWALGRILQLHPGNDNLVRVATVKTSTTIFKRPIVKLCPLNITFSSD